MGFLDWFLLWFIPDPDHSPVCPMCGGSKKAQGSSWAFTYPCPYCGGTGFKKEVS